jgi:chromosome segregation ATPase
MIGSVMLAASATNSSAAPLCFERRGDHFEESIHLARPQYIVALASDRPVEALPDTVYIETSQLGAYEQEIRSEAARAEAARCAEVNAAQLNAARAEAAAQLEAARAEAARCAEVNAAQLEATRAEAARRLEAHSALQTELAVLERVNSRAEEAHAVLRQRIEAEIRHVAHLQGEVAKREQAIADLRGEREQAIADLYAEVVRRDQRISELKASRFSGRWKRLRRRLTGRS